MYTRLHTTPPSLTRPSSSRAKRYLTCKFMAEEKGMPLPKFGDWDVNDPASADGFTAIFNKARDEKKTGGKPESPTNVDTGFKHAAVPVKQPHAKWCCCIKAPHAEP